jgi:hypothetical protein
LSKSEKVERKSQKTIQALTWGLLVRFRFCLGHLGIDGAAEPG